MNKWVRNALIALSAISVAGILLMRTSAAQQLQITSPADGATVTAGQSIQITVSASLSVLPPFLILQENPLPDAQPTVSPYVFSLTIPNTIPAGVYHLAAAAGLNGTDIESPS